MGMGLRLGSGWVAGVMLLVYACADNSEEVTSPDGAVDAGTGASSSGGAGMGGTAGTGGASASTSGGASAGGSAATSSGGGFVVGGSAGEAGAGGEVGEVTTGSGGTAGDGGEPWCVAEGALPEDDCVYPESLGGGDSPDACGVTPSAWYPLGDSELVPWPERASAEDVNGSASGVTSGEEPQLLLNEDGTGFLLASCNALHWDGVTWEPLTLPDWASSAFGCVGTIDRAGRLAIALSLDVPTSYDEYVYYRQLRLIRQLDSGWEYFGVVASSTDEFYDYEAKDYVTVFDSSNQPVVSYYTDEGWAAVYVERWDGVEWSVLSEADVDYLPFPHHAVMGGTRLLITPDDRPVVGMVVDRDPERLQVVEWTGDAWRDLASVNIPWEHYEVDSATRASLKLTRDTSGALVLTWPEADDLAMFVSSGSSWQHVPATEERLALLPEHVRWDGRVEGSTDIRARRFEDCRWTGWSASDRGGGVSNSTLEASAPNLAVGPDGVCVAWSTLVEDDSRVLVRCHD